ncbi:MAG: GNAT family N-acetyltransferase [Burkholderiaceae bacterium]|nr:GNAT family N-acetyltransferase [Burkholderiaceae bacterium]
MSPLVLRLASPQDFAAIRALLVEAGLPVEDVRPERIPHVVVASDDAGLQGCVALEQLGSAALLRSLAVRRTARRRGLGRMLVARAESDARAMGVDQLFLLTTSASGYFETLGYAVVDRDAAPDAMKASSQFAALCPASALCLGKIL